MNQKPFHKNFRQKLPALILLPALLVSLAACGGVPAASASAGTASAADTSAPAAAPGAGGTTAYTVGGYYTLDVPSDLTVKPGAKGIETELFIYSPDDTWNIYANASTSSVYGYAQDKEKAREEDDTFQEITVGGGEGYLTYNSERSAAAIYFPVADADTRAQYGHITVRAMAEGDDGLQYLEDATVRAILDSVTLIPEPSVVFTAFKADDIREDLKYWYDTSIADTPTEEDGWQVYVVDSMHYGPGGDFSTLPDETAVRIRVQKSDAGNDQRSLETFLSTVGLMMDLDYLLATQGAKEALGLADLANAAETTYTQDGLVYTFTPGADAYTITIALA